MDDQTKKYKIFLEKLLKVQEKYGANFNQMLAKKTGLSPGFISLILNNKKKASLESQIKIAKICNIDLTNLLPDDQPQHCQNCQALQKQLEILQALADERLERIGELKKQIQKLEQSEDLDQKNELPKTGTYTI